MRSVLFLIFCFLLFPLKAFSLTVAPGTIKLETEPDIAQTFKIRVFNEGKKKVVVTPSVEELGFTKKGKKIFRPVGSLPFSIARYITYSNKPFELEGQQDREIDFSITVPKGIIGGNRAMIFFNATPYLPPGMKFRSRVEMAVKLGATVLQETKGTTVIKSRIKEADIIAGDLNKTLGLNLKVVNEGNTYIFGSATVAILGKDETFVGTFEIPRALIFPGREETLTGELNMKVSPGFYHALITYQFRDKNITIDKPFQVK